MRILCIVPVYNEENRLQDLLNKIKNVNQNTGVDFLIINNGSTDSSLEIIKKSKLRFHNLKKNYGVGYALLFGLKLAIKEKIDYLVHLAGNGKMTPYDIVNFTNLLKNKEFDYACGSRFINIDDSKSNPLQRIIMIKVLSSIISIFFKRKITDATCGFRFFKVKIFKDKLNYFNKSKYYTYGYEYYTYGKILLSKSIKSTEVPVSMNYPRLGKYSKIRPIIDWFPIIFGYLEARFDGKKIF